MHDLETMKRLNDTAVNGIPVATPRRFERAGWVEYPRPLANGRFDEHLPTINEYLVENRVYIRRVQD